MGAEKNQPDRLDIGNEKSEFKYRYYNSDCGGKSSAGANPALPSVTQSIPYGTESGGFIDFFKSLLGKRKTDDDDFPLFEDEEDVDTTFLIDEESDTSEEQGLGDLAFMDSTGMEETLRDISESADTPDFSASHQETVRLSDELLNSRRFANMSSREMTAVKEQIRGLLYSLNLPIPKDYPSFMVSLRRIDDKYSSLINACDDYIAHIKEKGGAKHSTGRQRLALVTSLSKQYLKERAAFGPTARRIFLEKGKTPDGKDVDLNMRWAEVLGDVRTERISLSDRNVSTVGAGASMLFKRENEDGTVEFVKPEERLAKSDKPEDIVAQFLSAAGGSSSFKALITAMEECYRNEIIPRFSADSDPRPFEEMLETLCRSMYAQKAEGYYRSDGTIDTDAIESMAGFGGSSLRFIIENAVLPSKALCEQFIAMHTALSKKKVEMNAATGNAKIRAGSVISDRNDATSRLAKRYGISDVVASSHTALFNQGDGTVTRANVMESADGQSMESLLADAASRKALGNIEVDITYTPSSLMQMYTLEVFDLITGQADRHKGNYFVTVNKVPDPNNPAHEIWYIESIKGIDNDLAFGNRSYNDIAYSNERNVPLFDQTKKALFGDKESLRNCVEAESWESGQLTVHYLPESFYKRLVTYSPDILMLDIVDTRSREELEHLENRILSVVGLIKKYVEAGLITIVPDGDQKALQQAYDAVRYRMKASPTARPQSDVPEQNRNGVIWDFIQ